VADTLESFTQVLHATKTSFHLAMLRFASLLYICSFSFTAVSPAATPGPQVPALTFTNTFPQNVSAGQDLLISWTGGTTRFNLILDVKSKPETLSYIACESSENTVLHA
jgi:hypothetical protein